MDSIDNGIEAVTGNFGSQNNRGVAVRVGDQRIQGNTQAIPPLRQWSFPEFGDDGLGVGISRQVRQAALLYIYVATDAADDGGDDQ